MKKVKIITLNIEQHDTPKDKFEKDIQAFLISIEGYDIINMSSTITDKRYYFFCVYDDDYSYERWVH